MSTKRTSQQSSKKTKDLTTRREGGSKEDRTSQRVPVQLLVDYHCNGNYLFDFCRDLGTGGVFIETKSPLDAGSDVNLTFTIPDSKETLETQGKVIWVQSEVPGRNATPGMGVQFESFDGHQRKLLEDFLSRFRNPQDDKKGTKHPA